MPVCNNCDGESFHSQDGKYFCEDCGAQSQVIQVEVQQEATFDSFADTQCLELTENKERKRKGVDLGEPWVIHEGIQYLIKAQVEVLIKMGFGPALKEIVGQLWFSYLRAKKVAFCEEELDILSIRQRSQTGRNVKVGLLPPSIKKKRRIALECSTSEEECSEDEESSKNETVQDFLNLHKGTPPIVKTEPIDNESVQDFLNLHKGTPPIGKTEPIDNESVQDFLNLHKGTPPIGKTEPIDNESVQDFLNLHKGTPPIGKTEPIDNESVQDFLNLHKGTSPIGKTEPIDNESVQDFLNLHKGTPPIGKTEPIDNESVQDFLNIHKGTPPIVKTEPIDNKSVQDFLNTDKEVKPKANDSKVFPSSKIKVEGEERIPWLSEFDDTMESIINGKSNCNSANSSSDDDTIRSNVGSLNFKCKPGRKFSHKQTLSFCFMGLVWLEEPVLISDLVRWAREGTLPYHKASEILPEQMKFSFHDYHILNTKRSPCVQHVFDFFMTTAKLLKVEFCYTKEMCRVVSSAIIFDMELPKSVSLLVNRLFDITNFSVNPLKTPSFYLERKRKLHAIDAFIGAFVVISIKLVFYLDDQHEINGVVRDYLLKDFELPPVNETWIQWVTKHMEKYKNKLYNGIPRTHEDLKYIRDLSVYADYCTKDLFNTFQHRKSTRPYDNYENKNEGSFNWCAREEYHEDFAGLVEEMNDGISLKNILRVSTSFPFSVSHTGEVLHADNTVQYPNTNTSMNDNCESSYVLYTGCDPHSSWHSSYNFLMNVMSHRLELPINKLQICVNDIECLLFKKGLLRNK